MQKLIVIIIIGLILLMTTVVDGRSLNRRFMDNGTFGKISTIQMCQESCTASFSSSPDNYDFAMCYDYCKMLYKENNYIVKLMCNDNVCVS